MAISRICDYASSIHNQASRAYSCYFVAIRNVECVSNKEILLVVFLRLGLVVSQEESPTIALVLSGGRKSISTPILVYIHVAFSFTMRISKNVLVNKERLYYE